MDAARDPFGVAVAAIRARVRSGALVQGEQLMARELARELRLSATPVREALARLAGEGLIEDRRGAGYFAWRLDAVDLTELYDLQAGYLRIALQRGHDTPVGLANPPLRSDRDGVDPVNAMEVQLMWLVRRGRSMALQRAQALISDQLAPARRVERSVLPDAMAEWAELAALGEAPPPVLLNWIDRYAERRRASAADLVALMRSVASEAKL